MNNINLIGRLTDNPELKYVGTNNTALCNFSLAVSRNYRNKDGVIPTDFINIEIWGKRAETLCQYATKGTLIGISGSLRMEKYTSNSGENKTLYRVHADNFCFTGHKTQNDDSSNIFKGENLFDDAIDEYEELTEEEIPF